MENQKDLLDKKLSYYEVLGVEKDSSSGDIKRAYRKLAIQYHPDKQIGSSDKEAERAEKIMAKINKIFSVLMDADSRAYYDEHGEEDSKSSRYATKENSPIFNEIFKTVKMAPIETPYTTLEHVSLKPTDVIKGIVKTVTVTDYVHGDTVDVQVKIPSGTPNGSILTFYDAVQFPNRQIKSSISIAITIKQSKKLCIAGNDIVIKCKEDNLSDIKSIIIAGEKVELSTLGKEVDNMLVFEKLGLIDLITKERGNLILEKI